jgi:hypothetical protein
MSDPQQIERDLRDYLDKEPNLSRADRLSYLQTIFNRHLETDKLGHQITYRDYFNIISDAKTVFTNMKLPMKLTKKTLDANELVPASIVDAFLLYLNRHGLLKKDVKLDRTE